MISPSAFQHTLTAAGVDFIAGVPDSLLKHFCAQVDATMPADRHIIAANEGTAIGLATGAHLATGGIPLVYLQNSGLGNAVNPLMSLADPEVYAIPLILLIGWRGEPGSPDEPQHRKQGRVTPATLDALEIPWRLLDGDPEAATDNAHWAADTARQRSGPVALVTRKGAFGPPEDRRQSEPARPDCITREHAIHVIADALPTDTMCVATTGHIARELYEYRQQVGQDGATDFLTVGSMGHASQIALGIALGRPARRIACLDGDGAALMHLGGLATIGTSGAGEYLHIVLNNGVHDSVGGQPTAGLRVSLPDIARACGYPHVQGPVTGEEAIRRAITASLDQPGPAFIEIHVRPGARSDLGRPAESPTENRHRFTTRLRTP